MFTVRLPLLAALISMTALAAPKAALAPVPPQPVEQKVTVKRGGSVDVPLRIYGTRAQTLSWIVREKPARGKLSEVRATAPEAAVVTYRPPADLRVVSDRFTFSVRSNEGISAAVEVTIVILDDPPQLSVPAELNFGALLIGARAAKVLEFTNGGGRIAEGAIEADAPWRVEGARRYKLAAGERHIVKIVFAPEQAGKFASEVRFTTQPDRAVSLVGVAEEPLAVAPAELTLAQDPGQPLRAGSFELRNNTDAPLEVAIVASSRLLLPATLLLPPHTSVPASVQTAETDAAPLEETIRFTAGPLSARLPVKARALPALVRASPRSVTFRRIGVGAQAVARIVLENRGGVESKVALAIGAPFLAGEKNFTLRAGEEKEIAITLTATAAGMARSVLKVAADSRVFDIPVEADIVPVSAGRSAPDRPLAARPVARAAVEPEEKSAMAGSGLLPAKLVSIGENAAAFRWTGAVPPGATLRCRSRSLTPGPNGGLASMFHEYPACRFEQRDGAHFAMLEKLAPGTSYLFRIDAVTADDSTPLTFAQVRTPARPPRPPVFTLARVLIALAVLAGGASVWQRTRSRRE